MFKWLKTIGVSALQKSCRYNIRVKVKELIGVASRVAQHHFDTGADIREADQRAVSKAQASLLTDIMLGHANGLSLREMKAEVIEPILLMEGLSVQELMQESLDPARMDDAARGAMVRLALNHVLRTAAESLGVNADEAYKEPTSSNSPNGNQFTTSDTTKAKFFQGNVRVESFDDDNTVFRLPENGALISVRNDSHIRFIKDPKTLQSFPVFEVIAPMAAVELIEGEVPGHYLQEHSSDYYLTLSRQYKGFTEDLRPVGNDRYYTRWAEPRSRFEAMSRYVVVYGLRPEGPHRKLADTLLRNITKTCEACAGTGLGRTQGLYEWMVCPECHGLGAVYTIGLEELAARRQRVLDRYPEAGSVNWKPGVVTEKLSLAPGEVSTLGPRQ